MLISKYGFFDVLESDVILDPSRVAAQIVSGIGFIGAGLIFVRRASVRGLTTAAGVWLTAAVGAACGASLTVLAIATTAAYFLVVFGLAPLARRLPTSPYAPSALRLVYEDSRGILRKVLEACTARDFKVADINVDRSEGTASRGPSRWRSSSTAAAPSPFLPASSATWTVCSASPRATSTDLRLMAARRIIGRRLFDPTQKASVAVDPALVVSCPGQTCREAGTQSKRSP